MKCLFAVGLVTGSLTLASAMGIRASERGEPISLWPRGVPGETAELGEEKDQTKATEGLVAGKPVIRLGNVSRPTLTVYRAPRKKETGAAVMAMGYGQRRSPLRRGPGLPSGGSEDCTCWSGTGSIFKPPFFNRERPENREIIV